MATWIAMATQGLFITLWVDNSLQKRARSHHLQSWRDKVRTFVQVQLIPIIICPPGIKKSGCISLDDLILVALEDRHAVESKIGIIGTLSSPLNLDDSVMIGKCHEWNFETKEESYVSAQCHYFHWRGSPPAWPACGFLKARSWHLQLGGGTRTSSATVPVLWVTVPSPLWLHLQWLGHCQLAKQLGRLHLELVLPSRAWWGCPV